jgi:hypothetical protein
LGTGVTGYPGTVGFRSWDGPAALPDPYPPASTDERRHPVPATPTALPSPGTVQAAVLGERGRPSIDADGDVLSLARIEAFFAQDAFTPHDGRGPRPGFAANGEMGLVLGHD